LLFVIPFVKPIDLSKLPVTVSDLADEAGSKLINRTPIDQVVSIFTNLIPTNVFAAFASNDFLGVIVTGVVIGFLIKDTPEKPSYFLKVCHEVERFVAILIKFLISVGPIGVFFLILPSLLTLNIGVVGEFVGVYLAAVIGGCFVHVLVVYPLIYIATVRENPFTFISKCLPSIITALGTSSSAATLPVTMNVARDNLKIPDHISRFTLNIGTTCNMDGAALGFPIAVIFQAAAIGRSVTISECIVVVITSAMAAVGASPIPSAGLVLILMVMNSIALPITPLFGLIIAVDFIPDRFQTATNVLGDLMCSAIVHKLNPNLELNDDIVAFEKQMTGAHDASKSEVTNRHSIENGSRLPK
jgi:Na+/H+-dicarboxylate symporter